MKVYWSVLTMAFLLFAAVGVIGPGIINMHDEVASTAGCFFVFVIVPVALGYGVLRMFSQLGSITTSSEK